MARVRTVARGALPDRPRVTHTRADLRDPAARRALDGVDVLWHLGAQLWRGRDDQQASVNLDGTANVLAARPRRVVLASSAAVYGAHADNAVPLRESDPTRPNRECAYAWHKLESERMAREAAPTAVARIAAVLGAHADARVARAVRGYRFIVPAIDASGALQFLDEDDAASALVAAGMSSRTGTWNIAPPDWLTTSDVARVAGGRVVRLPSRAALLVSEAAFALGALPFGRDRACLLCGPLALDPSLAHQDLGWSASRGSGEVLSAAVHGAERYMRHVR